MMGLIMGRPVTHYAFYQHVAVTANLAWAWLTWHSDDRPGTKVVDLAPSQPTWHSSNSANPTHGTDRNPQLTRDELSSRRHRPDLSQGAYTVDLLRVPSPSRLTQTSLLTWVEPDRADSPTMAQSSTIVL
ncbi:hypothetical protein BHM03_00009733 [Ensete ventricosum]|nr:hypothetical protein BHM03_00009733 [Ensete ventricosum]